MNAYTQLMHHKQDLCCDVEILSEDDIISPRHEVDEFFGRLTFSELRKRICQDYEFGFVDAQTTFRRLIDNQLFGSTELFIETFVAGVKAREAILTSIHEGGEQ